jgi:putative pyruvate formate lyase activating enzyme
MPFEPSYKSIYQKGELDLRIKEIAKIYKQCTLCPHECKTDRSNDNSGNCGSGMLPVVSSASPHYGEEPPLVGYHGSGTIFFTNCNLHCIYCQNYDISQMHAGQEISYADLADIMIALQNRGCHNINFVTPTHMIYPILKALKIAIEKGLDIPLVYNSGGYDSVKTLRLLNGIIDIYMPDIKYFNEYTGSELSKAKSYPQMSQKAISEMHRQVGDLMLDENGIAYRGLLIRHLVLPSHTDESKEIVKFVLNLSENTYLNIMDQYRPEYRAFEDSTLTRRITSEEYREVVNYAKELGLKRYEA